MNVFIYVCTNTRHKTVVCLCINTYTWHAGMFEWKLQWRLLVSLPWDCLYVGMNFCMYVRTYIRKLLFVCTCINTFTCIAGMFGMCEADNIQWAEARSCLYMHRETYQWIFLFWLYELAVASSKMNVGSVIYLQTATISDLTYEFRFFLWFRYFVPA